MKKVNMTLITSLIVLSFTVLANAAYRGTTRETPQTYQMRQTSDESTSMWNLKIGVGFNEQIYAIPATPVALPFSAQTTVPADISLRVLVGPIGGEFDIGGNQYAIRGIGDVNVFDVGMKAFYAIISKPYVHFNGGMSLNYSDVDVKGYGVLIGTGVNFFAGPEFFIPQIPELGFNIEVGLGYQSYSYSGDHFAGDNLGFNAADFLQAGIHYYF